MVLTLQFDEVWLSGSIGAKSSRNLQLHSQPSMELSVPNPIAPLCQLTQVFASSKLSMPEPLWGKSLPETLQSSAKDLAGLGHGVWPASLAQVSLEQVLSIYQALNQNGQCHLGL